MTDNPDYNPLKYPFLLENGHIICVVGAGGKTSWIKTMASFCTKNGMKALVTTTTHQGMPEDGSFALNLEEANLIWSNGSFVTVGEVYVDPKENVNTEESTNKKPNIKIKAPSDVFLKDFIASADIVFMEADGSRHKPIKAPACYEPVIHKDCDIVVGVVGMHALGHTVGEVGFRLTELTKLLECDLDHVITEEDIDKVFDSEAGLRKNVEGRVFVPVRNFALSAQIQKNTKTC